MVRETAPRPTAPPGAADGEPNVRRCAPVLVMALLVVGWCALALLIGAFASAAFAGVLPLR